MSKFVMFITALVAVITTVFFGVTLKNAGTTAVQNAEFYSALHTQETAWAKSVSAIWPSNFKIEAVDGPTVNRGQIDTAFDGTTEVFCKTLNIRMKTRVDDIHMQQVLDSEPAGTRMDEAAISAASEKLPCTSRAAWWWVFTSGLNWLLVSILCMMCITLVANVEASLFEASIVNARERRRQRVNDPRICLLRASSETGIVRPDAATLLRYSAAAVSTTPVAQLVRSYEDNVYVDTTTYTRQAENELKYTLRV